MKSSVAALGLLLCGCASKLEAPSAKELVTAPYEPWSVSTLDASQTAPAWLSNGLIGMRIGRDGTGNGLPCFSIDEYEPDGEEKIRLLPHPLPFSISVAGNDLSPELGTGYRQTLDFRTGRLTTAWRQKIAEGMVEVESKTVVHPNQPWMAQQWRFLVPPGASAQFHVGEISSGPILSVDASGDSSAVHFEYGSSRRRAAHTLELTGGWEGSFNHHDKEIVWSGRMLGSKWLTLERRFQIVPDIAKSLPAWSPWKEATPDPTLADIEIDGPIEDQQAIRSFLYYLRSSISPDGKMSVSPFGLSSAKYNGHVFWDADVWVFPALALVDPERAKAITSYRVRTMPGARENYAAWLQAGRPTATRTMGSDFEGGSWGPPGHMFAWESSVTGRETIPSHFRSQHHVTGSVAWGAEMANTLGFIDNGTLSDFLRGGAHFFDARMTESPQGYEIKDTMSPNESRVADNDLYTNLLAQLVMDHGLWWRAPSAEKPKLRMKLPRDATSLLTYDGDELRHYQQAAAVLAIYPLQYPEAEREARAMLERFEPKTSPNGPAMSESMHALIWARLGERERAYETWRKSWLDFTRQPLLLFAEKRAFSSPDPSSSSQAPTRKGELNTYFVTGAAGCLQTVIFGFLGFRIDDKPQPGALWSTPLENGKVLSVKPNLPPAWKKVTFRNFTVLGKRYTLEASQTGVRVTPH